ncbi:hypothetical protein PC117_g11104 [Phytophthora cactorum]|uniref:Uncharacterized protein n=1 Tax=Phytophthora cactorum TaxID=29920 RepID=A0A8T1DFT1_9STRA|nr:hypothetical protein PC117_g11104 [Phytophthora cactorum]
MAGSSLSSSIFEKRYSGPRQIHLPQRQAPRGAELHGCLIAQTNGEYKSTDRVAGKAIGSAIPGGIPRIRRPSNWITVLGTTIGSGASCTSEFTRASYNLYSAFEKSGSNFTHSTYSTPGITAHIDITLWSSCPCAMPHGCETPISILIARKSSNNGTPGGSTDPGVVRRGP